MLRFLSFFSSLAAISLAQADVINIAFHQNADTVSGFDSRPDGEVVSTGSNGSAHWNNFRGDTDTAQFSGKALVLGNGESTTATLGISAGFTGSNNNNWSSGTDDHVMFEGWYGLKHNEALVVAGLPANFSSAGYTVIVYGDSNDNNRTMHYTIGEVTKMIEDRGTFSGTVAEDTNQATFTGLTESGFTITGNPNVGDFRSAICGIQIITNDHPKLPRIGEFTVDDQYLEPGQSASLSWVVDEFSTGIEIRDQADNAIHSSSSTTGSFSVTPQDSMIYTLTASNAVGSSKQALRVTVGPARPNIVFFLVDDMGPQDTSVPFNGDANGEPVSYNFNRFYKTPHMETLAANGMRFTAAYAQSVCSPTRSGLMTGRNSTRHAVTDWVGGGGTNPPPNWRREGLDGTDVTLPQILSAGGYRTIHVGKAHFGSNEIGRDPLKLGFDVNIGGANFGQPGSYTGNYGKGGTHAVPHLEAYHNTGTYLTNALAQEANKAIESATNDGVPFFLNMSFYAVHAPFTTNPDATGDYSGSVNANHAKYATMIEGMDLAVGAIRQKLIDLGVAEDTLIVFIGDNGSDSPALPIDDLPLGNFNDFPMRGKKGSKWEGGIRIPFLASWAQPNSANEFQKITPIPANSIETDIVASWDIPVTFLKAAGLAAPANFGEDGHDLLPYFRGTAGVHRPQELIIHYPHNHRSNYFTLLRDGDLKLIYNCQDNSHQLYNLANDPTENNDLANDQPEDVMRLTRKLAQRLDQSWGTPGPLISTVASSAPKGNVVSIPNNPAIDTDGDGLPDTVEDPNLNGLVDPGEPDPDNSDTDGDGINDGAEIKTGTDPLDSASVFRATPQINAQSGELVLRWPSKPGASYTIKTSVLLQNDWQKIATNIPATDPGNSTTYLVASELTEPARFYRVGIE